MSEAAITLITVEQDGEPIVVGGLRELSRTELTAHLSTALQNRRDAYLRLRHFRSDSVFKLITTNPKLAEWRAKVQIESTKEWVRRRKDFDDAEHDVEVLRVLLGVNVVHNYGGMI